MIVVVVCCLSEDVAVVTEISNIVIVSSRATMNLIAL